MVWIQRICALCFLVISAACSGLSSEPEILLTRQPRPTDIPESFHEKVNIRAGAMIYAQNCASCHGLTGAGDGDLVRSGQVANVPDFTDASRLEDRSIQAGFDVITDGRLDVLMPPWRDALSATDRWAVAFYTYTLSYDPTLVAQGEALYRTNCAACHGDSGDGGADGPALIGLVSLTEADLLQFIGTHPEDVNASQVASEVEQRAVVQYLRLLSTTSGDLPGQVGPLVQSAAPGEDTAQEAPGISQATGTIRGRVIQGTPDGSPVAGLDVTLHIVDRQPNEQIARSRSGADGSYQFDDVVISRDLAYAVSVNGPNNIRFSSDIQTGNVDITEMSIDVSIYERTSDPSVIEINSRAFQVDLTPHGLYIIEVINLTNTSDRYVYAKSHDSYGAVSVSFPLAENVRLDPGHTNMERLLLSETGHELLDTQPILPGEQHYVQFSYALPLTDNMVLSLLPTEYHTQGVTEFYVDFNHLTLQGTGIEFAGNQQFDGGIYRVYTVTDNMNPDEVVDLRVVMAVPEPVRVEGSADYALAGLFVISGSILLMVALLSYSRQRRRLVSAAHPSQEDLITQIAQLDNQFAEGTIDAAEYEGQRKKLKLQLALKMKQSLPIDAED